MSHIVSSCLLTKLRYGLFQLHSADDDALAWRDAHDRSNRLCISCGVKLCPLTECCLCYSEEQECMNVWTAYLNFENMYGTQSRVDDVLRQAQLKVDPVAIQRKLCDIYARSGKFDVSERIDLFCSY